MVSTLTTLSSSQPTLLFFFSFLLIVLIVRICGVEYAMTSEDSILLSLLVLETRSQTRAQAGQDLTEILSQLLLSAGITGVRRHSWQRL